MDISIWSHARSDLPNALPQSEAWIQGEYEGNTYFVFEADGWLINAGTGDGVPNAKVRAPDPMATFETYVSLEPIGASADGYAFLEIVVRAVTKASDGFWEHPGDGRFYRHSEGRF